MKVELPNGLRIFFLACIMVIGTSFSSQAKLSDVDSLLLVIKKTKTDTGLITAYKDICRAYLMELNNIEKVMEYAGKILAIAEPIHNKKGIVYGKFYYGISYWSRGQYQQALSSYNMALVLMRELNIKKGVTSCYLNMGLIHTDLGEYQKALNYMEKALKADLEQNNLVNVAIAYNNIGNIYLLKGDYTKALNNFFKSLKVTEERKDTIVSSYNFYNIADVFFAQTKYDEALDYYQKGLRYLEKVKDKRGIGDGYMGIGNVFYKEKEYNTALQYHSKNLKLRESIDDKLNIAVACNKIGLDYLGLNNFAAALSYQQKSLRISKEISYKKGIAEANGGIAIIYEQQQRYNDAITFYNDMLKTATEVGYKEGILKAYTGFASIYKNKNDFENALLLTKRRNELKDSLMNKDIFKQVAELNSIYENDKKEQEIMLLIKDKQLNEKIIHQQSLVRWGLTGGLGLLSISVFSILLRYRFKQKANVLLEKQKKEIQLKNTLITDSIDYAQTIQEAIFPNELKLKQLFPQSFVFYKPKSVVSGDFFWIGNYKGKKFCAVADCTGHGVPGAFMSLLSYNMLENIIKLYSHQTPSFILDKVNIEMKKRLSRNNEALSMDGMDISLVILDENNCLHFSGAHHSVYILRNHELTELKGDAVGIGDKRKNNTPFTSHQFQLQANDHFYLFTDGFPDQMGGEHHKKFFYKPFKDLLNKISNLSQEIQKTTLQETLLNWIGSKEEQIDDVLVIGMKV